MYRTLHDEEWCKSAECVEYVELIELGITKKKYKQTHNTSEAVSPRRFSRIYSEYVYDDVTPSLVLITIGVCMFAVKAL